MKRIAKYLLAVMLSIAMLMPQVAEAAEAATAEGTDTTAEAGTDQAATEQETTEPVDIADQTKLPVTTDDIPGWPQGPYISDETGVLMEADSGVVLYNKGMDDVRYPASTTKIMTALLALENSNMDDVVTMTEAGMAEAYSGSSNIIPVLGETFTMEQCLYMILLKSANDVATQVAEYVGGSVDAFVAMMNDRAAALGCKNTHFANPSGLPDDDHYTTAYDLALIMQEALKNETFRQIINTKSYVVPATNMTPGARTYENHHHMILDGDEFQYEGTIGGKTGFTDSAWCTLVTAAERNGTTLICVVLKVPDRRSFSDTISLMDYGFSNFVKVDLSTEDENAQGTLMIPNTTSLDQLTTKESEGSDGQTNVEYYFGDYKVGSGILTVKENVEAEPEEIEELEENPVSSSDENGFFSNLDTPKLIICFISLLIVAGLVCIIVLSVKNHKKKKKRKQKNRNKK